MTNSVFLSHVRVLINHVYHHVFKITLFAVILFGTSTQTQAQLYCGQSVTCPMPVGIGGINYGLNGASFSLSVTRNTNYGGGLLVTNTNQGVTAYGIYAQSPNGVASFGTSTTGTGIYGLSTSGKALFGQTTSGYALFAKSTGSGLAGLFEGDVEVTAGQFTVDGGSSLQFGLAHFKAGANRQIFIAPNLGGSHFNGITRSGDLGLFFSDGNSGGSQNQSAGLVLAPWTGGSPKGLRIDANGRVGIGLSLPQVELDVEGSARLSDELSVPRIVGEQNGNTPFQLRANTGEANGSSINLWGNGSTTNPGDISLVASNGNGINGGEIRFLQNLGAGSYEQQMVISSNGKVGIGINSPTAALHLKGDIKLADANGDNQFEVSSTGIVHCRAVTVDAAIIPDYVFDPEYKLMPLSELRIFVQEERHLPGVKSEAIYQEEGVVELAELSLTLLEKVEELTLYTLELEEKLRKLEAKIAAK